VVLFSLSLRERAGVRVRRCHHLSHQPGRTTSRGNQGDTTCATDPCSFPTPPEMTRLSKHCVSPSKGSRSLFGSILATCGAVAYWLRKSPRRSNRRATSWWSSAPIRSIPHGYAGRFIRLLRSKNAAEQRDTG